MQRISFIGLLANLAAVGLLALTGAALATPLLPAIIPGFLGGFVDSTVTLTGVFVDTLSAITVGGGSSSSLVEIFYAVYGVVSPIFGGSSSVIGGLSGSGLELLGYLLGGALSTAAGAGSSVLSFPLFILSGSTAVGTETFFVVSGHSIPEPSGIAVLVTGVAGAATLLRRRRQRRAAAQRPAA